MCVLVYYIEWNKVNAINFTFGLGNANVHVRPFYIPTINECECDCFNSEIPISKYMCDIIENRLNDHRFMVEIIANINKTDLETSSK